MTRHLIIGNSAGSIGAIEAIRQVDREGALTVISEEPYPAYSRPQIGRYLTGEISAEKALFRPRTFYPENKVDLLLGRTVVRIEPERHVAVLNDGRELEWDKLLLATGGTPIVPPTKGLADVGYSTFMTLEDVSRLREQLPRMKHAIIIGGGLIGLSATEALSKLGVQVTVIELAPQILGRALDGVAAGMVQRLLESHGVRLLTGCSVVELRGVPGRFTALLSNGVQLEADTLILAIGVRPRLDLATQLGLSIGRGVVVDSHMRTSHPDIYACGDVVEAYDFIAGGPRLTPIWPNAYLGGRIAGLNMAGRESVYGGGTAMNALHFFGYSLLSAGLAAPDKPEGYQIITHHSAPAERHNGGPAREGHAETALGTYKKVVLQEGVVVGFIFAGEVERAGVVYGLMKNRVNVSAYADKLVGEGFGLISLPVAVRRELLGPQQISPVRTLDGAR